MHIFAKHPRLLFLLFFLVAGGMFLWGADISLAEEETFREYQVKAAFMVNMAKFISWPNGSFPSANEPFVIGIAGDDPFKKTVTLLKKKTIKKRPIDVVYINSPAEVTACHMIFVAKSESRNLQYYLNSPQLSPSTVTISDMDDFLRHGGMIAFTLSKNRLAFKINNTLMKQHGLSPSASLLNLAIAVE